MKRNTFLLFILVFLSSSFIAPKTWASDAVSLKVAPLFFDLNINPGEEKSGQIYVENNSQKDVQISVEFSDFFIDDGGNYIFSQDKIASGYSMKDWFSSDTQLFNLKKEEGRAVNYSIKVPSGANLGGHYGAIFFRTACQKEEDKNVLYSDKTNLCVSGRVGTLFLVQAGGEARKTGEIKKIALPRFTFSDKVDFEVDLRNSGNSHFRPEGSIVASSLFGKEIFKLEVKDKTLLPGKNYALSGEIKKKDVLGAYLVQGKIKDGEGNDLAFRKLVVMFPWKETVFAVLVLGAGWFFRRKFKIKMVKK